MKILEIKNNHGFYIINGESKLINYINKEDLFIILDIVYTNDEIECYKVDDTHPILNDAEKVIYENIYKYLEDFVAKKENIIKEINDEFQEITQYFENEDNN